MEGLGHIIVAHVRRNHLGHDPLRLSSGLLADGLPGGSCARAGGCDKVDHTDGLGLLTRVLVAADHRDAEWVLPVYVCNLPGGLQKLVGVDVVGSHVNADLPLQEAVYKSRLGRLQIGQGGGIPGGVLRYFCGAGGPVRLGISLGAPGHLLPDAVDHVGAGTAGLGGDGESIREPLRPGPAEGGGGPVAAGGILPGGGPEHGQNLVIGQGDLRPEAVGADAAGDPVL